MTNMRSRARAETCPPMPPLDLIHSLKSTPELPKSLAELKLITSAPPHGAQQQPRPHQLPESPQSTASNKSHGHSRSVQHPSNHSPHHFHLPARGHHYARGNRVSICSDRSAPDLVSDDHDDSEILSDDESPVHASEYDVWDRYWKPGGNGSELVAEEEDIFDCYLQMPTTPKLDSAVKQHQESLPPVVQQTQQRSLAVPRPEPEQWPLSNPQTLPRQRRDPQAPLPLNLQKELPKQPEFLLPLKSRASYSLFPKRIAASPRSVSAGQVEGGSSVTSGTIGQAKRQPFPSHERLMDKPHYDANGNTLVPPVRPHPSHLTLHSVPVVMTTSIASTLGPPRPTTAGAALPSPHPQTHSAPAQKSVFEYDSDSASEHEKDDKPLARIARALHLRSSSESRKTGRGVEVAAQQQQQQRRARAATVSAGTSAERPSASVAGEGGSRKRHGSDMFGRLLGRK